MAVQQKILNNITNSLNNLNGVMCQSYTVNTEDGLELILHRITKGKAENAVLLLHGLTVRANVHF